MTVSNLRLRIPGDVELLGSLRWGRDKGGALLEVRVQTLPAPARVAQSLPGIVVSCRATVVEHAVHDRATTQNLSNTDFPCLVVEKGLGLRDIVGPQQGLVQGACCTIWKSLLVRQIIRAGLNDQDGGWTGSVSAVSDERTCRGKIYPSCSLTSGWPR